MPDDTITLIALKRQDARAVNVWLLMCHQRPAVASHFRRCLSEEVVISKPMAYVVMENDAAMELYLWLEGRQDIPYCVEFLRNSLANQLGVEQEDIHEGGPR